MAEVLACDSPGEVEELAAVDVPDARSLGASDDEGRRRHAAGDIALACGEDPVGGGGALLHGHRRRGLSLRVASRSSGNRLAMRGGRWSWPRIARSQSRTVSNVPRRSSLS